MNITGGKYNGRKVCAPDESITRPTLSKVRMGVFNTLFSMLGDCEGKTFLDLFGGSGIMGLEALSRGFEEVYVCEKNPKAYQVIKKNYASFGLNPNIYQGDSLKFLKTSEKTFDVIYIDPPYESGIYSEVFNLIQGSAIVVAENSEDLVFNSKFKLIKEKNYGGKRVSFFEV